jgi:hypothetical protein
MNNHYRIHLSVPGYIRQGLKLLKVTNTPAYYDTELFTAIKKFIVPGPGMYNSTFYGCSQCRTLVKKFVL